MNSTLPKGKIDPQILASFIKNYTQRGGRILVGAHIGEDATVIDMGSTLIVAKTDPITHATAHVGHYVVNINANDIAVMGGRPLWFLATVLMPEGSRAGDIETVFSQISQACKALGVSYCGGHTEITGSVNNPVVAGQMLGEVRSGDLKPSSGALPGDELLMTKCAAIEATAIMALEKEEELKTYFPEALVKKTKNYLHDPGISVVKEAMIVTPLSGVHALHDPTEGGIATGIFELAIASNLGVEVYVDRIPVTEETLKLCRHFGVDPLGTFASGSLLIAVSPEATQNVIDALSSERIPAARIGTFVDKEKGMAIKKEEGSFPLPVYHQDELSKIFG